MYQGECCSLNHSRKTIIEKVTHHSTVPCMQYCACICTMCMQAASTDASYVVTE